MNEKEPQPFSPEKETVGKKFGDKELKEIISFISDGIWLLIDDEKNGFPQREDELQTKYEERVLKTKDKLRHVRKILVGIYKNFPHLKPDRIQQRDMGIYDLLKEDTEDAEKEPE